MLSAKCLSFSPFHSEGAVETCGVPQIGSAGSVLSSASLGSCLTHMPLMACLCSTLDLCFLTPSLVLELLFRGPCGPLKKPRSPQSQLAPTVLLLVPPSPIASGVLVCWPPHPHLCAAVWGCTCPVSCPEPPRLPPISWALSPAPLCAQSSASCLLLFLDGMGASML